ncbi:hypothetical protein ABZ756_02320 [Mammaliicoccus sciuri]
MVTVTRQDYGQEVEIVDTCVCCGAGLADGQEVLTYQHCNYYFCSSACVVDQMLKESNITLITLD